MKNTISVFLIREVDTSLEKQKIMAKETKWSFWRGVGGIWGGKDCSNACNVNNSQDYRPKPTSLSGLDEKANLKFRGVHYTSHYL